MSSWIAAPVEDLLNDRAHSTAQLPPPSQLITAPVFRFHQDPVARAVISLSRHATFKWPWLEFTNASQLQHRQFAPHSSSLGRRLLYTSRAAPLDHGPAHVLLVTNRFRLNTSVCRTPQLENRATLVS